MDLKDSSTYRHVFQTLRRENPSTLMRMRERVLASYEPGNEPYLRLWVSSSVTIGVNPYNRWDFVTLLFEAEQHALLHGRTSESRRRHYSPAIPTWVDWEETRGYPAFYIKPGIYTFELTRDEKSYFKTSPHEVEQDPFFLIDILPIQYLPDFKRTAWTLKAMNVNGTVDSDTFLANMHSAHNDDGPVDRVNPPGSLFAEIDYEYPHLPF